METIKIAHLYYDLMNLYGEIGNIMALVKTFAEQDIDCVVDKLSVGDKMNLSKYDIIYIGQGSEENQLVALEDIIKHKETFENAIEKEKVIIATGNAYELFGKYIEKVSGKKYKCLNLFNYYAKEIDERIKGEQVFECDFLTDPIIGFQNRQCVMNNKEHHLFTVINGHAGNYKTKYEWIRYKNFFGTYMIGPLLIRNPHLTNYIVKSVLDKKNIDYIHITNTLDYKAYNEYVKNFIS